MNTRIYSYVKTSLVDHGLFNLYDICYNSQFYWNNGNHMSYRNRKSLESIGLELNDGYKNEAHKENDRLKKMVYDVIENSLDKNKVSMTEECFYYMNELRNWMFQNVYKNSLAVAEEDKAKNIVEQLFEHYTHIHNRIRSSFPLPPFSQNQASFRHIFRRTVLSRPSP